MSYVDDYLAIVGLPDRENTIPWLYKDSVGVLTVGKGTALPTLEASQKLQWYAKGDYPATPDAIKADWNRVFQLPKNMAATRYESPDGLYLMQQEIDMQAEASVMRVDSNLAGRLPYYAALPDCVKLALLDMGYNLGVAGLLDKFPKMMSAVKDGDFKLAAVESNRPQLSITRNAWTKAQLLRAV